MGRPSKLTPSQWADIERRAIAGEGVRELAREFGVDPATISRRVSQQTQQVKSVAQQLATAHAELEKLPPLQQHRAQSLAESLRNISSSLAAAGELGAKTAHRLNSLANNEVGRVDDADPMASLDNLRNVGVLTKLANDSASIALNLLAANKDTVTKINAPDVEQESQSPMRPQVSRDEWLKLHGRA